jgi:threonine synthase
VSAYTGRLACQRCNTGYDEQAAYALCPVCREQGVNVYPSPVYDLTGVTGLPAPHSQRGVLRFSDLLPFGTSLAGHAPQGLGEGDTPLLRLSRAGAAVGLESLWLKDESRNPTWSYKDRLAVVAVNKALAQGADTVVVSSTGNHGAAIAAYAARLGVRCVVLTLESVPQAMKVLMQSYGAQVAALREPAGRWAVMRDGVQQRGWVPMSGYVNPPSGSNPFGVDGYKSIAYELWEQFDESLPDVIVAPVAYGDGIAGLVRGFEDLIELRLTTSIPRIVAAETYGAYSEALAGRGPITDVPEPSVAFSIAALTPTWQGLNALKRSAGTAARGSNTMILEAQAALAGGEGLYLEPSSALTYAVLPGLLARGTISATDRVVLLGTSTGLKDVGSTAATLAPVPVIEPTLASFDAALG